jgi:glutathione S-transferase
MHCAATAGRSPPPRWPNGSGSGAAAVAVFTYESVVKKMVAGADPDPAEVARGSRDLARFAAVLEQHLAGREWLAGETLTLADFAVAAPLMYLERARLPLGSFPRLLGWFERVQQLHAWRATNPVW